jgi:hypothetical protein
MPSASRRVFAVLAWRPAAAAMAAVLLSTLSLVEPPARATAQPPLKLAASGPWLDRLNVWRISTGLSALTENTTWSAGDYNHALYMVKNNLVTHYETPGVPYYTSAGDTAARNGNIYVSSSTAMTDTQAIDWWMQAPFHALGLMDPRLTTTAFGSYREVKSGWQMGAAVDVLRGNPFTGGHYPVFFPGNGTTEPLTSYGGHESPDPLQACSGYAAPTGLPVFIQVGGNVTTTVGGHSFTGNGTALAHCVIDSHNAALGSSLKSRGAVVLIPRQPLQNGVTYSASLTVNSVPYTWSFTVGPFAACNTVPTGPTADLTSDEASPQPSGSIIMFTATSTGCSNPEYRFYVQNPLGAWFVARDYGGPTFTWNTVGLVAGTWHVDVWVRQRGSGNAYEAFMNILYVLTDALACVAGAVSSDKATPQQSGTIITFTASSTVCPQPTYQFYIKRPNGYWYLMKGYGTATFVWNTGPEAAGTYTVMAWVRQSSSTAAQEDYKSVTFSLSVPVACAGATLTSDKASPQPHGTTITFTGAATSCSQPQFIFYVQMPNGAWYVARTYGGPTFVWSTTGLAAGVYHVNVWARQNGSSASYQAFKNDPFTLT